MPKTETKKIKKSTKPSVEKTTGTSLSAKTFDIKGKSLGTTALPKEFFGQVPNEKLLSQALRIYRENIAANNASTKTRGEVRGGGAKPWRQKGTGKARAGSRRSPLWVGGGITFGPRPKNVKLNFPKKMKHKALIHALSAKTKSQLIFVISNLENTEPKTKVISNLLKKLNSKGNTLLVVSDQTKTKAQNVKLASRNIPKVSVDLPQNLNAYQIMQSNSILISKESLSQFK